MAIDYKGPLGIFEDYDGCDSSTGPKTGPTPITFREEIERKIALQYSAQSRTIDYPGLTRVLVAILKAPEFSPADRIELSKQAIEAYTRQGYFV